jgi:hypothetical protein
MLLPLSAEGVDTTLGQLLSELKVAGEHQWKKIDEEIHVLGSSGHPVLTISSSGNVLNSDGLQVGSATPLPERK